MLCVCSRSYINTGKAVAELPEAWADGVQQTVSPGDHQQGRRARRYRRPREIGPATRHAQACFRCDWFWKCCLFGLRGRSASGGRRRRAAVDSTGVSDGATQPSRRQKPLTCVINKSQASRVGQLVIVRRHGEKQEAALLDRDSRDKRTGSAST